MDLVQRVKDILLNPKEAWPTIEAEATDVAGLYKNYVIFLAAIPAIAGFIGMSVFGFSMMGMTIRVPLMSGLAQMVIGYVLSLAMVFVVALIVDALAPSFGGQKSQINALKLVAYGSTAGMVGGIFSLIPAFSMLGLLTGLYSIYLMYLGLPVLMKCPKEKVMAYTVVILVCAIIAGVLVGTVSAMFSPAPAMLGRPG